MLGVDAAAFGAGVLVGALVAALATAIVALVTAIIVLLTTIVVLLTTIVVLVTTVVALLTTIVALVTAVAALAAAIVDVFFDGTVCHGGAYSRGGAADGIARFIVVTCCVIADYTERIVLFFPFSVCGKQAYPNHHGCCQKQNQQIAANPRACTHLWDSVFFLQSHFIKCLRNFRYRQGMPHGQTRNRSCDRNQNGREVVHGAFSGVIADNLNHAIERLIRRKTFFQNA